MPEIQKTALITGGSGFIGSHLTPQLERLGYRVDNFDIQDRHDITDRNLVFDVINGHDVIFHLAGVLGTHELNAQSYEATQLNVLGAVNIYDAALRTGARVILAAKPNPWLNTYSITKKAAEDFARMYAEVHGLDTRVGRFFNLYGPGQAVHQGAPQKAVPTFIIRALENEPLPVFGTGKQSSDFMYVDDATKAFAILGHLDNLPGGQVVEIGTGDPTTVNFLADMIIRICDSRSKVEHLPMRSGEPLDDQVAADIGNMTTLLNFSPQTSLEDGLRETVNWYRRRYFDKRSFFSIPSSS